MEAGAAVLPQGSGAALMNADNVAGATSKGSGASSGNIEQGAADRPLYLDDLGHALIEGALPGEIADFGADERRQAAEFVAGCAQRRPPGIALVRLESVGGQVGQRRMR